jgi:hypothetical protein
LALLQRLLLLPLLAPLLLVLLVGALNPRPNLALRLLIWSTPSLPIGAWIALAAGGGAGLSAAAAALALQTGPVSLRHQVRRDPRDPPDSWQEPPKAAAPPPPRQAAGPQRPPGDPAPTVAVPFRVIRKGRSTAGPEPAAASTTGQAPTQAQATAMGDGWDSPGGDDW